ncbi:GIY-YIG nuclease family protein [Sutcliffiella halmapala]|uniref:GIY-YIG nuclease family protein n=1 Tax=Sutcliffiella halmapala TaxID=79882 RepID=UPI0009954C0D|nr:GIY-YIG nuclease family protein [Sutcliffiella halmapala]
MENKLHYFYVLECRDQSYYAGYTNDLEKRITAHNKGKGAKYTRSRRPVVVIYQKPYETKQEAMRAEKLFKQLSRKQKEKYLNEGWNDENMATE